MLAKTLTPLSLLYLALPYLIFFVGWLRLPWAAAGIGLLCLTLSLVLLVSTRRPPEPADEDAALAPRLVVLILLVCAAWLYLGGIGGYGYQDSDWIKHEAVLKDLSEHPWPVTYDLYGLRIPLTYYVAYYLPAAVAGKEFGWASANLTLYLWSLLGLGLAVLWFLRLVGRATPALLLLFVGFAGLDLVGQVLTAGTGWAQAIAGNWRDLERWPTLNLQYNSPTNLLFWVPHQALVGWIATGLIADALLRGRRAALLLVLALTALWSPFVLLGLMPFLAVDLLGRPEPWRERMRGSLTLPNLGGLALLALTGLFYAAKLVPVAPFLTGQIAHGFAWTVPEMSLLAVAGELLAFALLEFGLYALLALPGLAGASSASRRLFWTAIGSLIVLLFYRVGLNNDLAMRTSIPALFVLMVYVGRALVTPTARPTRALLVAALLVGGVTVSFEFARHLVPFFVPDVPWQTTEEEKGVGVVDLFTDDLKRFTQYIGSEDAPFYRLLARPLPAPSAAARPYLSYGDKILYAGYTLDPATPVAPGATVRIVLELHVFTGVIDRNYSLALRLVGEDGREYWQDQGWPQNRPTSAQINAVLWYDTRTLTLASQTPPGLYRLELAVVDPMSGNPLPAHRLPGGQTAGDLVPIGYVEVEGAPAAQVSPWAEPARLGDTLAVVGATIEPAGEVTPGETLTVTLRWQARAAPTDDYTGFVHLLDAAGTLAAQWDQPPRRGFLPTHLWRTGFTLDDDYPIPLPATLAPGVYRLVGGMYAPESGARLPASRTGQSGGDTFAIGEVTVRSSR
jgi:hypothetical protein